MKKKIIYTDASKDIEDALFTGEKVLDFLPPPENLVKKEPKVKVTISLNSKSVDFFKQAAKKNNVKYQTMINELLDSYVRYHSQSHK